MTVVTAKAKPGCAATHGSANMINKALLAKINEKIEAKNRIEELLRSFESPYVETTVGLIEVNSTSPHEAKESDEATWLHRQFPAIEKELKARTAALLKAEAAKIDAWLSERVVG